MKLTALFLAACATVQSDPPSVLVIVLDDVASADLALYGGPVSTPYISQLAAAGVTFTNAYANAYCAPSRRSLVFGTWAIGDNGGLCSSPTGNTPQLSETSIAEALSGHAAAMIGKWHLGSSPSGGSWQQAPLEHGFEYWGAGIPGNIGADQPCGAPSNSNYTNWLRVDADSSGYVVATTTTYQPLALRDFFIAGWLASSGPRLGIISLQLAHSPFHSPPAALLPSGYPSPVSGRDKFEAMVAAMDKTIGQMLAHVDLDTTLIVVVGDNGTPPNAAPAGQSARVKGTTFERGVRVPLIVAGAGLVSNPGRTSAALVHLVDIYSTTIEACGGSSSGDGVSFLGELTQTTWTPRDYVFLGDRWEEAGEPGDRAAVSATGWKLRQLDDDSDGVVDTEELYDLTNDPTEQTNVISSNPTTASQLRGWLESQAP